MHYNVLKRKLRFLKFRNRVTKFRRVRVYCRQCVFASLWLLVYRYYNVIISPLVPVTTKCGYYLSSSRINYVLRTVGEYTRLVFISRTRNDQIGWFERRHYRNVYLLTPIRRTLWRVYLILRLVFVLVSCSTIVFVETYKKKIEIRVVTDIHFFVVISHWIPSFFSFQRMRYEAQFLRGTSYTKCLRTPMHV